MQAFKMTLPVENCGGNVDGRSCAGSGSCSQPTVCLSGACTCIPVVPTVACVAAFPVGRRTAIFGYNNQSSTNIKVPSGGANVISDSSNPGATPPDLPPDWFVPGARLGVYAIPFDQGPVTWRLGSQTVQATMSSTACPLVQNGTGWSVTLSDGSQFVLQSDSASAVGKLHPRLECVRAIGGGQYTAYLGFENTSGARLSVPVGGLNTFSGLTSNRGQFTSFLPGAFGEAFAVTFDGASLTWTLAGETLQMSAASTPCIPENCSL
jgi:hypothetical protein